MSRFVVKHERFRSFLEEGTYAPVTKNKERKRLLSMLRDCIGYASGSYEIPVSLHTSIITFLLKEGKGDKLRDDEILNFVTSMSELNADYEKFVSLHVSHVEDASQHVSPVTEIRSLSSSAVPRFRAEVPDA